MGVVDLLLVAIGLAMDAFAVSVGKGLTMRRVNWRVAFTLALFFGGFQALMPIVGWALGSRLLWLIEPIDHWIAFTLLALIGVNMVREALMGEEGDADASVCGDDATVPLGECLVLAVATSIDALAVGISLAALGVAVIPAAAVIGVVTFALSLVGVAAGNAFGVRYERWASALGGVILIVIGTHMLLEHLGILAA